ncbi:hypothetical protein EMERY_23 [Brevibacillus phage Emery]|nr:hypothetical protein EMERY_23 [Brevibacillus phage Emery]
MVISLTKSCLEVLAEHLLTKVVSAEVELDNKIVQAGLTKTREGTLVRFNISLGANSSGVITNRILKNDMGEVFWSDQAGKVRIIKPKRDMQIVIPIDVSWLEGGSKH